MSIAIHKDFPIGSKWMAPHPFKSDYHEVEVINHTVGAGLRRRRDAGIMVEGWDGGPYEVASGFVYLLSPAAGNPLKGWG